ncbi:MAG: NAD(P)-dependent oxidoreductase [Prevotellaceae bacterium]|jgi:nucleoside-diphosphate-sugar epimerase|nr:NAD(P)-dependent oxidoreductase [Prevotellaceae bacterium]
MNILITGASGFLGAYLLRQAVAEGFSVFAGVRASSNVSQFDDLENITFLDLPYHDPQKLEAFLFDCKQVYGKFDYIVHNAGLTKCRHKSDFDRVNFRYTKNFVEALVASDSVPTKFLFVSSLSAVSGGNNGIIRNSDLPQPNTLYGMSKHYAEDFLESHPGFPYLTVRPTGIYGVGDKDYTIYLNTINHHIEPYLGSGKQHVSFIFVTDLVELIFSMLRSEIVRRAYCVSDGKSYTQQQYAAIVKKALRRRTIKIVVPVFMLKAICNTLDWLGGLFGFVPTLNADKFRILTARNWTCDISDLRRDFDFHPKILLKKGVEECVKAMRKIK